MRVWVLSDLHMEFGGIDLPKVDADVVILAGDTNLGLAGVRWAKATFAMPVLMVLGNHEYYDNTFPRLIQTLKKECRGSQITILENSAVTMNDVTFLGCTLWSSFAGVPTTMMSHILVARGMNDYRSIRRYPDFRKLQPADTIAAHQESVDWLGKACRLHDGKKKVVITHHAPSLRSVPDLPKYEVLAPGYATKLDALVEESNAALWVHGHIHVINDYLIGTTRVLSNPRGYRHEPVPGFSPDLVIEV
ncbi:MAG: hypothetical protein PCFJNLEI_03486 [Verrucomicrobiae bacterium]|nr:hypothetical protein [Verrucomicrobiae bacterium]